MIRSPKALLVLSLFASAASAQRPTESAVTPPANSVVRAWQANRYASPRSYWGKLVALTPDSVVIQSTQLGRPIALGLDSIARLEYSTGREPKTRNILIGAGVGGVVGVPLFLGLLVLAEGLADSPTGTDSRDYMVVGTVGAFAGAGLGTMIGAMFPGRRQWLPVPVMARRQP